MKRRRAFLVTTVADSPVHILRKFNLTKTLKKAIRTLYRTTISRIHQIG